MIGKLLRLRTNDLTLVGMEEVTRLLDEAAAGDQVAAEKLLPLVYDELRKLAAARLAQERAGHTLASTALVHEAYLRLVSGGQENGEQAETTFANRRHFFAAAAEAMRRILVESARRKNRLKRGGDQIRIELTEFEIALPEPREDLLELDEALERFATEDKEAAEVVKLHYFAGMSLLEIAELLGVAPRTCYRYWAFAKAWLKRELANEEKS